MISPDTVRIDAATICQLKCPSCPTAGGDIGATIGSGFLKFDDFKKFLGRNRGIKLIELSNWGEVFLNPELERIIEYAHEQGVELSIANGANLNNATPQVLEALVKCKVRDLNCSIDGATQETYSIYRVKGNLENVLQNIKTVNQYKRLYKSDLPRLTWQFVVFGHNEHEIDQARAMAEALDMHFYLKLNWDDLYDRPFSPAQDVERLRDQFGAANRQEFLEKHKRPYIAVTCTQLWTSPQINFNGEVLGCCINHWASFGNAFQDNLSDILNDERMTYAREMLEGKSEAREDIPCTTCKVYSQMKEHAAWVKVEDVWIKKHTAGIKKWMLTAAGSLKSILRSMSPDTLWRG